ncbi:MAG TPA: lasso RiPP family leader peptide-containing protein [Thermoanaerobaculia bacterium]|nr:lasso RiPP family leader peptide-containing protein [Thermoanaerobaculia bacterium]
MNDTYEMPELFELGTAAELTLGSCGGGSCDCEGKPKCALMDIAY